MVNIKDTIQRKCKVQQRILRAIVTSSPRSLFQPNQLGKKHDNCNHRKIEKVYDFTF